MVPGKVLQGPDVSGWQPGSEWSKVAAAGEGYFGFAKATESTYYRDATYAGNRSGMRAAGFLLVGAYCFAQAAAGPVAQADFFVSQVGSLARGEAAVLDAEVSGLSSSFASSWATRVAEEAPGLRGLYCSLSYYSDVLGAPNDLIGPGLAFDFLWIAAYYTPRFDGLGNLTNGPDSVPWSFWQYTDKQTLPGIQGTCDDSFYRYSLQDLRHLVGLADSIPTTTDNEEDGMFRYVFDKQDYVFPGAGRGDVFATGTDGELAALDAAGVKHIGAVDSTAHDMFKTLAKGS